MEQQHKLQQDIINHELFKTATFFDPEIQKECAQKLNQENSRAKSHQQPAISISYSPRDTFKSPDAAVNPSHNQFNSIGNGVTINRPAMLDSPQENNLNERNLTIPQLAGSQQGLHSSSNRKRPLLAFKLSPSSTRSHQQAIEEKQQENDFEFIQSVQDAEFWNKVNMIISENEENNNKNLNQGRLVSLPAINQKGELVKKQDRLFKRKLASNHISQGWEMGSSCSTRDSLRQNQSQFTPPLGQQHTYNQQQQQQSLQPKQLLQFSQSTAALKKNQCLSLNNHLNTLTNQKHLLAPSSVNLKSPLSQQNQHSFQLDSLRTEESTHLFSPEQKANASSSTNTFNPSSNYSDQLSTNANSIVSGASTLGQSQSHSILNSKISQQSLNSQPYFQNNLIMRQKSPSHDQANGFYPNYYPNTQQQKLHTDQLGRFSQQNQGNQLSTQQQERLPVREDTLCPSIAIKNSVNIHLPLKYGNQAQQRAKRDSYISPQQNSQNEFLPPSSSAKKNLSMQSHKLLHTFKIEDPTNNTFIQNVDSRKRIEQKQNNLLKDNSMINQLNTSIKRNQQHEQIPSPRERLGTYASQNQNLEQFDNYQFLKCNEDISHPSFNNLLTHYQSHRLYTNQNESENQIGRLQKFTQQHNKIEDPLRRSMCNNGQKNDFSFCDDGANNLMKISQSAQGYREQAKKINLRSKQQENLVKKLFKIEDKQQNLSNSTVQNNYFTLETQKNSQKQQKILTTHQ